jgi:hypothetical protein
MPTKNTPNSPRQARTSPLSRRSLKKARGLAFVRRGIDCLLYDCLDFGIASVVLSNVVASQDVSAGAPPRHYPDRPIYCLGRRTSPFAEVFPPISLATYG